MSSIEAAIADDLLERVKKTLGYHPPVEQVDFCCSCAADDGGDGCTCDGVTAFIYWGRGDDDWTALGFDRPEVAFDSDTIEAEMCKPVPIDPQALAQRIMEAVKRREGDRR